MEKNILTTNICLGKITVDTQDISFKATFSNYQILK